MLACLLVLAWLGACRSTPRRDEFGWPADVQGDVVMPTDAGKAPLPVTCPVHGWLTLQLEDGGEPRTVCAPDLPVWGVGPLTPISLTLPDNGVVADNRTHRQWQLAPLLQPMTWQEASQACDDLNLGDKRDWRLPTLAELITIVDFARSEPAVALPFDATPGEVLWSAVRTPIGTSLVLGNAAWTLDFSYGLAAPEPLDQRHSVRCVRADASPATMPAQRFSVDTPSAVIDHVTRLEWDPGSPAADHTGYQAIGYCRHMNKGGMGWHNADVRELASLLDRSRVNPALPEGLVMPGNVHVQSGNFVPELDSHWQVDFVTGVIALADNSVAEALHCVRPACGNGLCGTDETAQNCPLDCQPMVQMPAGTVWMGCDGQRAACGKDDSKPQSVHVEAFAIDPYEATVLQWQQCALAGICRDLGLIVQPGSSWPFGVWQPVNLVSWQDARKFCQHWRGKGYDLPTQAQWERAARGTCEAAGLEPGDPSCAAAMRAYPWGQEAPDCSRALYNTGKEVAAFADCAAAGGCGCGTGRLADVGTHLAGDAPGGVHDLAGGVAEWTVGPEGQGAVTRGGSFLSGAAGLRASLRVEGDGSPAVGVGFRCVKGPSSR